MKSKSQLNCCIGTFAQDLSSFVQRTQDSISSLKRIVEQRPQAGGEDFRECLVDLEQRIADFTEDVQQLAGCTSETISLEELLGHCTAVYSSNRATALALEQHLSQYGYQKAVDGHIQPENPYTCIHEERETSIECGLPTGVDVGNVVSDPTGTCKQSAHAAQRSPVDRCSQYGAISSLPYMAMSPPGGQPAAYQTPAAADQTFANIQHCFVTSARGPPLTTHRKAATPAALTQVKQERDSLGGISNTSSTPAGLLISPGVAALANKYATSSVGGSSVSATSSQSPSGHHNVSRHSPYHGLNLSYSTANPASPNLPIFGLTPPNESSEPQPEHLHQPVGPLQRTGLVRSRSTPLVQTTPAAEPSKPCLVTPESGTTGDLYDSLIHSNLHGPGRTGGNDTIQMNEEPMTPPARTRSCPASPGAPPTAGRLPAEWHSKKMQELESLQADLTITLSQMKRTPSRSRLPSLAAADQKEADDVNARSKEALQEPDLAALHIRQQLLYEEEHGTPYMDVAMPAAETGQQPPVTSSDPSEPVLRPGFDTAVQRGLDAAVRPPRQLAVFAPQPPPAVQQATTDVGQAAAAKAAVSAAAAAAAAASADLESLMASLSMKYAAAEPETVPLGAPSSNSSVRSPLKSTHDDSPDLSVHEQSMSPPAPVEVGLSADETSLISKYAAVPTAKLLAGAAWLPPAAANSPDTKHTRLAAEAAAGASRAHATAAYTSTESADVRQSCASSTATTPGKPCIAAAVAAGMAAWRTAVNMDCPSPLSPASAVDEDGAAVGHAAVRYTGAAIRAADARSSISADVSVHAAVDGGVDCSADVVNTPEPVVHDHLSSDVGGFSLLTPTTQDAIRHAVHAAGLSTAADRPKSSIRRMQPTTDLSRLEEMRGLLQNQQRGLADRFETVYQQQQQHQRKEPVVNLEARLAAGDAHISGLARSDHGLVDGMEPQLTEHPASDLLLDLRKQKGHAAAAAVQKQVGQIEKEANLTPRAARLQRRHQVQEEQHQQQQQRQVGQRRAAGAVLQSVENTAFAGSLNSHPCSNTPKTKASATQEAKISSKIRDRGDSGAMSVSAAVDVKPVSEEEFAGLPGWCRGLLTVNVLNAAVEELSLMVSARSSKCSSNIDGFTAADLELLGHSSSKSKTIVSCLHKLSRATLQRSAAGNNIYKLVGTVAQ